MADQRNRAFVLMGSNIDPEHNIRHAVRRLTSQFQLLAASPVYQTAPVGRTDQPDFYNAALLIETDQSAARVKEQLQRIEQELGRVRTADKNAPRTIDLDIVLFNDQVLDLEGRHIPDPDLLEYAHVAVPLADLAPTYIHPETEECLLQIANRLPQKGLRLRADLDLSKEP